MPKPIEKILDHMKEYISRDYAEVDGIMSGWMPKTVLKGTAEYRSWHECWYMSPGPERSIKRAMTDPAVAFACAEQWG